MSLLQKFRFIKKQKDVYYPPINEYGSGEPGPQDKDEPTRVAECIKTHSSILRKEHPEWGPDQIQKVAQTECGQKTTVPKNSAYLTKYDAIESDECVSRKISIFSEEHPEWKHEQVIAAAMSWCKENSAKDSKSIGRFFRSVF